MKLVTLTPIHIGSGEILTHLSYVIDRNSLFVLNMDKFFYNLTETQREHYLQWMNPILNRMAELDEKIVQARDNWNFKRQLQNQKRELEEQLSISWFLENRLRQNSVDFAKRCLAYQIEFLLPPGKEGFKTHIKGFQNSAYIPGTEIKGAIRTSLLYLLLRDKKNYEILRNSLNDFMSFFRSSSSPREKVKKLSKITNAQSEDGLERKLLRGKERDAKYDLLKLINVSDTNTVPPDTLQISTIKVLGSARNIRIWIETLLSETEFHFNFRIQEKAFLDELGLERLKDWLSLPKIFEACYYRSAEILQEEERYFDGVDNILNILSRLKKENQPNTPLLRLGWGQGFLGTTLNLKVKQNDPDLYDQAVREGVSFQRRWRTQSGKFPKTRRVIVDAIGNPVSLLGWVRLTES